MIAAQLTGHNQSTRLIGPAFPFFCAALGIAAARARLDRRVVFWLFGTTCVVLQVMIIAQSSWGNPEASAIRPLPPHDHWDWFTFQAACDARGLHTPTVAYLGNDDNWNEPQIQYPWVRRGDEVRVDWLWRYEDGPIGWERVLAGAGKADVVVTSPGHIGNRGDHQELDNANNTEFAQRLVASGRFDGPFALTMGQMPPTTVIYFFRRRVA